MAKVAWIIGNGPSRQQVKLNKLEGTTFGCNALYRDFKPDYLVSGDAGVIKEICTKGYPKKNKCIFPDWSPVPIDFKDMSSEIIGSIFSISLFKPENKVISRGYGTCKKLDTNGLKVLS